MTEASTYPPTFSLFPRLPLELRNQIWQHAMPKQRGPVLQFYRKGCWCPRRLTQSDEGYDPEHEDRNMNLEFRHNLLEDAWYDVPLLFVCRESRGIALAWVHEQGLTMCRRKDGGRDPVCVRPFDPLRDALYVASDKWDDFVHEVDDRTSEPDLYEQLVDVRSEVECIAIPQVLLEREKETLCEIFQNFGSVRVVFIVVGQEPKSASTNSGMKLQRRWELEGGQDAAALCWNPDKREFDLVDGERHNNEILYRPIMANLTLVDGLVKNYTGRFEFRAVSAIRR